MPLSALVAVSLGGLWLAIWRGAVRWWGMGPMLLGAALAISARSPDMLVAPDARTIAVRGRDGLLHFLRPPEDRFAASQWLRRDGDGRDPKAALGLKGLSCDGFGCAVTVKGRVIAASLRPGALAEDCLRADVVVTTARESCHGPDVMIDARTAEAGQGWRIDLTPRPRAISVRASRGKRPWVE
jgi:competence protein ComEC